MTEEIFDGYYQEKQLRITGNTCSLTMIFRGKIYNQNYRSIPYTYKHINIHFNIETKRLYLKTNITQYSVEEIKKIINEIIFDSITY